MSQVNSTVSSSIQGAALRAAILEGSWSEGLDQPADFKLGRYQKDLLECTDSQGLHATDAEDGHHSWTCLAPRRYAILSLVRTFTCYRIIDMWYACRLKKPMEILTYRSPSLSPPFRANKLKMERAPQQLGRKGVCNKQSILHDQLQERREMSFLVDTRVTGSWSPKTEA